MGRMGEEAFRPDQRTRARSGSYLEDLLGFPALDALCADERLLRFAIDLDSYLLQIGQPAPLADVVRVAHVMAGNRLFPAYGAFSTHFVPPICVEE